MLKKIHRLTKEKDFKLIARKGRSYIEDFIRIKVSTNDFDYSRFGIVVGLKISKKAVIRNRIKRQIRQIIRTNLASINKGIDVMLLPMPAIIDKEFGEIAAKTILVMKKAKIIHD